MPLNKIPLEGLSDSAQTTISDKANRSGDTFTGTVSAPQLRSNRTSENARDTGFQLATGTDIGEANRSTQYYDDLASNCNGYMPNGNCAGNANYTPPNGNWWTWGVSGIPTSNCANYGSYNAGVATAFYPVSVSYNYDGYYEATNEIGGSEQHRNFRNCNCGAFNCRTNCNCNCNCDCRC